MVVYIARLGNAMAEMGEAYDAKIKGLFMDMFPEHPFAVLPTVEAVAPLKPASDTREKDKLETARLGEVDNDDEVVYGDEALKKYASGAMIKSLRRFPEQVGSWFSMLGSQEYAYTLELFLHAVCLVDNADNLRRKLSDSAGVLQRYVGSYIAAIIELLLDDYFRGVIVPNMAIATDGIPVQKAVLDLDWRFSEETIDEASDEDVEFPEGDPNAFVLITQRLLKDIGGALPQDHHEFIQQTFSKSTSQFRAEGTYVDYAMIKDPNRDNSDDQITSRGTFSCIPGKYYQTYLINDVYVELKVKSARSHRRRDHYNRAVESVYRHRQQNVVSACFCLSHFRSPDEASTSTVTAFRLPGGYRCYEHQFLKNSEDNALHVLPATYGVETRFKPDSDLMKTQSAYWTQEDGVWVPRYSPEERAGLCVAADGTAYIFEYEIEDNKIKRGGDVNDSTTRKYDGKRQRVIAYVTKPGVDMLRTGLSINFYKKQTTC